MPYPASASRSTFQQQGQPGPASQAPERPSPNQPGRPEIRLLSLLLAHWGHRTRHESASPAAPTNARSPAHSLRSADQNVPGSLRLAAAYAGAGTPAPGAATTRKS